LSEALQTCYLETKKKKKTTNNINNVLWETGCKGVNWIKVLHNKIQWQDFGKIVTNLQVP
jgi:hypothetical protein